MMMSNGLGILIVVFLEFTIAAALLVAALAALRKSNLQTSGGEKPKNQPEYRIGDDGEIESVQARSAIMADWTDEELIQYVKDHPRSRRNWEALDIMTERNRQLRRQMAEHFGELSGTLLDIAKLESE